MPTDFKRESPELYNPPTEFVQVDVPAMTFLTASGVGDPNGSAVYEDAVKALMTASYAVRAVSKHAHELAYVVAPLEGFWTPDAAAETLDKSRWAWTMAIRQPEWMDAGEISDAANAALSRRAFLSDVRCERIREGLCVQIMHIGSYAEETPTLERLHGEYLPAHDLTENGRHHEIYLGDPRKVDPARLKTILRQPVRSR